MGEVGKGERVAGTQALADPFEEHRGHLKAVSYRMLGSPPWAEDAVQEAWTRLSRADRTTAGTWAAGRPP